VDVLALGPDTGGIAVLAVEDQALDAEKRAFDQPGQALAGEDGFARMLGLEGDALVRALAALLQGKGIAVGAVGDEDGIAGGGIRNRLDQVRLVSPTTAVLLVGDLHFVFVS